MYIKMVNKYQKNKERLWKEARERYQNLSEKEKEKKAKKGPKKKKNILEKKKRQNLWEYMKNII